MQTATALILWDIDGTLIGSDGFTETLLRTALALSFGSHAALAVASFAGKTDAQIIEEIYGLNAQPGLPAYQFQCAAIEQFIQTYHALVQRQQQQLLATTSVLPGVVPVLQAFAQQGSVQSIITGNVRSVAQYKLALFGLDSSFDLRIGAYGDESTRRTDLVDLALQRACVWFPHIQPATTLLIGDTPNDIAAGRARGVHTVGVATGIYAEAELRAAGADLVVPSLCDTFQQLWALLVDSGDAF